MLNVKLLVHHVTSRLEKFQDVTVRQNSIKSPRENIKKKKAVLPHEAALYLIMWKECGAGSG